jgi:hypothetical protein
MAYFEIANPKEERREDKQISIRKMGVNFLIHSVGVS